MEALAWIIALVLWCISIGRSFQVKDWSVSVWALWAICAILILPHLVILR